MDKIWKKSTKNYITPGGDPIYECPECGYMHVYGVEHINNYKSICLRCGLDLRYPWETEQNQK